MGRIGPWLVVACVSVGLFCAGAGASSVWAVAWSLDGSRAWWTADLRALVVGLAGLAASALAALIAAGVGAAFLSSRTGSAPEPSA